MQTISLWHGVEPRACLRGSREIPVSIRDKLPPIVYDTIDSYALFHWNVVGRSFDRLLRENSLR